MGKHLVTYSLERNFLVGHKKGRVLKKRLISSTRTKLKLSGHQINIINIQVIDIKKLLAMHLKNIDILSIIRNS